jgi:hypothetical protein
VSIAYQVFGEADPTRQAMVNTQAFPTSWSWRFRLPRTSNQRGFAARRQRDARAKAAFVTLQKPDKPAALLFPR